MTTVDDPHVASGYIAGSKYVGTRSVLRYQVVTAAEDPQTNSAGFANAFGAWFAVSRPAPPSTGLNGAVSRACEFVGIGEGDQRTVVATRDDRVFRFAKDVKDGEFALVNFFGNRLLVAEKVVSLTCKGGFLNFDSTAGNVVLAGVPSGPGAAVPYLTIDRASGSIALVSSTGAASIDVRGNSVTLSGSSASIDAGSVNLGVGAADGVVIRSLLLANQVVMMAWANSHVHLNPPAAAVMTGPPAVPLVLSSFIASTRVKAAP